jgi:solute carrier family 25 carnitine/acylcarnitine transporter 20/29
MTDAPEPPPTEQGLHPAAADFIAGGIAGAAGVLAGQPLDTVRIRMQQPGCPWGSAGAALRATVAREGPAALFRGVTYPLATISFQNAIVFQAFGIASRHLMHECGGTGSPLTYPQTFLSGMAAGVVQTFIVAPVELLKVRQQLQTAVAGDAGYVGPVWLLRQILRAEGVRAAQDCTVDWG